MAAPTRSRMGLIHTIDALTTAEAFFEGVSGVSYEQYRDCMKKILAAKLAVQQAKRDYEEQTESD